MTDNTQDSAAPVSASAAPNKKLWYVVHAYSGMEKSVQRALAAAMQAPASERSGVRWGGVGWGGVTEEVD